MAHPGTTHDQPAAGSASPSFTPGPWRVTDPDKNGQTVVSARDYEVATCWHHCVGSIEKEAHANAFLIASAPSLYGAALPLAAEIAFYAPSAGEDDDEVVEVRLGDLRALAAALAKATDPSNA
jgi:hypothetical protein